MYATLASRDVDCCLIPESPFFLEVVVDVIDIGEHVLKLVNFLVWSCIKVALDFVSPENVEECVRLTEEFRMLPKHHRAKEDKLEVKKMTLYAVSSAVREAKSLMSNELSEQRRKKLQAKEVELRRREQDVYMYFRGSGKAAEMKCEAAKRTMMAALP